jgi:hypothetical protein
MTGSLDIRKIAGVTLFASLAILLGACSSGGEKAPTTSTTSTTTSESSTPAPSPTEKSINPTGGNSFTPTVKAPGLPTPAPGNLPGNHPN